MRTHSGIFLNVSSLVFGLCRILKSPEKISLRVHVSLKVTETSLSEVIWRAKILR